MEDSAWLWARGRESTELLPCVFHPVIQKKSQYCSPSRGLQGAKLISFSHWQITHGKSISTHKEREEEKGGLPKFLPWQCDRFIWLRSTAVVYSLMLGLLFKAELFLELEWRPSGPGCRWPHGLARGTSLFYGEGFADPNAILVANSECLLLATWLFLPNPIFSLM